MKNLCLYIITMLLLACCSEQQVMEDTLSSQKLTEQKGMTVTPQDSINGLSETGRLLSRWYWGKEGFLWYDYYGSHG